jgi:hypothetical protein
MKRINILLEESDYELLRKLSYEQHKPISKIVRELVEYEVRDKFIPLHSEDVVFPPCTDTRLESVLVPTPNGLKKIKITKE